ncbi:hypothetical protein [Thalassotalea sediminis]|uniref:hypothetical protein n=1 Tax=Thalassotalea sediminis TaxID=1759089 RepID=UPI0025732AD2|nr:hypothetical protein [Thalassotalea sediminis]
MNIVKAKLMNFHNRLKSTFWKSLAIVIVLLIAGPELLISMELMALVELIGASTFVIAYLSGIKLFLVSCQRKFINFERYSVMFIPSWRQIKSMPGLALHMPPERTLIQLLFTTIYLGLSLAIIK